MGLQQFEQRLERLVEGVFAKAFRSGVQPVELGRRLIREMDLHRRVGVRGLLAPNRFTIGVGRDDRASLATIEQTLLHDLSDLAREHGREEGYRFPGPITVELVEDASASRGTFRLAATFAEGEAAAAIVLADRTRLAIGEESLTIGRASDCALTLADPTVSKHHAEVRREGTSVVLVDLGSTNGTSVNGARVHQQALNDGDEIRVGAVVLRFEAG